MQVLFYEHSVKKIREEARLARPVLNKNAEVVKHPKPTRRYVVRQRSVRADSCSASTGGLSAA